MPDQPSPLGVKQIDHQTIVVRDLAESRRFYVGVLGMREIPRPDFGFPGLWFEAGNTYIHLILEHEESGPAGQPPGTAPKISRTRHLAFLVSDARQALEQVKAFGIPVAAGPQRRPDGPLQFYIHDPDGHLVEIFSMA